MERQHLISLVIVIVIVAFCVLIGTVLMGSFTKLESSEVGLRVDPLTKTLSTETSKEGLYTGLLGFHFVRFPSVFKTLDYHSLHCLNQDGVDVKLDVSLQYRIRPNKLYKLASQYVNAEGYRKILRLTAQSAIQDACSRFNTSQFQSERGIFQQVLTDKIALKLEVLDCDISGVQLNNIERPREYENVIEEKESAREDIEVARQECPRRVTEARTILKEATSVAQIIREEAESRARMTLTSARANATAVLNDFKKEAESYKRLIEDNQLDTEGLLAYLGVRVISSAQNPVYIGMKSPAKTSYQFHAAARRRRHQQLN